MDQNGKEMENKKKRKSGDEMEESENQEVKFLQLFRFAKWWEVLLIGFAMFFAAVSATCMPLIIIIYGEFTTLLVDRALTRGEVSSTKMLHFFGGAEVM